MRHAATSINQQTQFVIPKHILPKDQTAYCLSVIDRYRKELNPLRGTIADAVKWKEYWRKKAKELEEKNTTLKKERDELKEEIERITKTNNRYRASLFEHGNFKDPQSSKKNKGGQQGHADTNRERHESPDTYEKKRIYAATCGKCHKKLTRVNATQDKLLMDIIIHPEIIKQILQSERQWCGRCKKEVVAKDERSLPFTEYGINTFMTVILLRFKCKASLANTATVVSVMGLPISSSAVSNILKQAKCHLNDKYEDLRQAVRDGDIMYNDETGWMIRGERAWMWIMTTNDIAIYHASESRGKGNAEELYGNSQAYSMHDGYAGYTNAIPEDKHLYCWAHILRYAHEETHDYSEDHSATLFREDLVNCYQLPEEVTKQELEDKVKEAITKLIKQQTTDTTIIKIQNRLKTQKDGLIRALLLTPCGTNNISERDLRDMAITRQISYGSDTFEGMQTTAILGSIVKTIEKQKEKGQFIPTMKTYLHQGIQKNYPQYSHQPFYDSS
jgi:transposase